MILQQGRPARRLARLYELPDPLRSMEDYRRLRHLDLPGIPTALLARERHAVYQRLMATDPRDPWNDWLEGRLLAIEDQLDARRSAPHRVTPSVPVEPAVPSSVPARPAPPAPFSLHRKGGARWD